MIPFNNPNATQQDYVANAGGPINGDRIANVGGGAFSSGWILAGGLWHDAGIWIDTSFWED